MNDERQVRGDRARRYLLQAAAVFQALTNA
jgi:hypothetical protein